ncbi:MAG TPA: RluA family pseudouridine synthase [Candidatus Saccharimonadales bacterium]|nr:RluA family pseudouridine synthase [Candidatus Saccharimonadales bacterium]
MKRLDVIYEDQQLLVVNKPAGVIVNRADTTRGEVTLQDMVDEYFHRPPKLTNRLIEQKREGEYPPVEEVFLDRSGIVHRLDKETSGIILVAKNPQSFGELQRQFKERIVHKVYAALAHGKIVPSEGEINVPVGRLEYNRKRFGVVAGGRESVTHYKVLREYISPKDKEVLSLVELYPKTGRTHQIRVHLQYIHHPIFSDEFYSGRKVARNDRKFLPRVFLHAAEISFLHPTSGKELHFTADLPEELQNVLDDFS